MRLLHLKKEKIGKDKEKKVIEVDHLCVGANLNTLFFLKNHLQSDFKIINPADINFSTLIHNLESSVILSRGELSSSFLTTPNNFKAPRFYKDQNFKEFGGRAKPLKMLDYEEIFKEKPNPLNLRELKEDTELEESFNKKLINLIVVKLDYNKDNFTWTIFLSDGSLCKTKKLYWAQSRSLFFKILSDETKKSLTEAEVNSLNAFNEVGVLSICFNIDNKIENSQTSFIPQSYTHEWGHFIFDVISNDSKIYAYALTYDSEVSEQEIGRKVSSIKKSFNRLFEAQAQHFSKEEVLFEKHSFSILKEDFLEQNLVEITGVNFLTDEFTRNQSDRKLTFLKEQFLSQQNLNFQENELN